VLIGKIGAAIPQYRETAFEFLSKFQDQNSYRTHIWAIEGYRNLAAGDIDTARRVLLLLMSFASPQVTENNVRATLGGMIAEIISEYPSLAVDGLDIINVLRQDPEEFVREEAEKAYERHQQIIRQRIEHDHLLLRAKLETDLPQALRDETLARLMLPLAINLATTTDTLSRRKAIEIIGQLGRAHSVLAADSVSALGSISNDPDSGVRLAIVQALAITSLAHENVADDALAALIVFTTDHDPLITGLAINAVEALGKSHRDLADEADLILQPLRLKQMDRMKNPQP
jgi:hypothetical protein